MRRTLSTALVAVASALVLAVPAAAARPATVEMRTISFAPSLVTFGRPGRTVRWLNVTSPNRLHDVVSSLPEYFGSTRLGSGGSYSFHFTAAGSFTYVCSIHDLMLGRVEVTPIVAVVGDAASPRLRITLGTVGFAVQGAYRWSVFLRGPSEGALHFRRGTVHAVVELPVEAAGDWSVMVRVRHRPSGTHSSDSPTVTVTVPG